MNDGPVLDGTRSCTQKYPLPGTCPSTTSYGPFVFEVCVAKPRFQRVVSTHAVVGSPPIYATTARNSAAASPTSFERSSFIQISIWPEPPQTTLLAFAGIYRSCGSLVSSSPFGLLSGTDASTCVLGFMGLTGFAGMTANEAPTTALSSWPTSTKLEVGMSQTRSRRSSATRPDRPAAISTTYHRRPRASTARSRKSSGTSTASSGRRSIRGERARPSWDVDPARPPTASAAA